MALTLDPNDLALFAHVMDAGSFTAAAARLGWPKSTLSRRLSALETRLGERLMQRSTRRLSLTDFGASVLVHARQVVAETDSAQALAQFRQARPSGHLRVSMPADLAELALGDTLLRFVQAHPAITLDLDLSPRRVDLIAENYDLALRMGSLPEDGQLAARRLGWFTGGLYASLDWVRQHDDLRHPRDLLSTPAAGLDGVRALVLGAPGAEQRPWRLSRPSAEGLASGDGADTTWEGLPPLRTVANAPGLLMRWACAGLGVAELADVLVRDAVSDGRLCRVLPEWQMQPVPAWAVFPERRLMPAKTRVLLDALSEAMAPCREPDRGEASSPERHPAGAPAATMAHAPRVGAQRGGRRRT